MDSGLAIPLHIHFLKIPLFTSMENLALTRLRLNLVVAVCKSNNGIGFNNELPWKIRFALNKACMLGIAGNMSDYLMTPMASCCLFKA